MKEWTVEQVITEANFAAVEVLSILRERGHQYGEAPLQYMSLAGVIPWLVMKALRLWTGWKRGSIHPDSLQDLVGYGLLALAVITLEKKEAEESGDVSEATYFHSDGYRHTEPTS